MTLELSQLTENVKTMGEIVARRRRAQADLVTLARQWLKEHADRAEDLGALARSERAAIPAEASLDAIHPLSELPERYTAAGADGSQIQPDRHGAALYHVINVGSLIYRHGSGEAPEARSEAMLGFTEDDLYENGLPVAGNLLDVRRDLAEMRRLAEVCERAGPGPIIALADGPLTLWVLKDLPGGVRETKVAAHLNLLDRIRRADAIVGGFVSRPGSKDVTRLLHVAHVSSGHAEDENLPNPLERLADRSVFATLPAGTRSALYVSPKEINEHYYAGRGHEAHFFYVNMAEAEREPVIARVEVPAWVARDSAKLNMIHALVVAQARITGDYPYVLARADELAYVSGRERAALENMVMSSLIRAGVQSAPSPKARHKRLTRQGF